MVMIVIDKYCCSLMKPRRDCGFCGQVVGWLEEEEDASSIVCFSRNRECECLYLSWRTAVVFNGCPVNYKRFMDFPYCTRHILIEPRNFSSGGGQGEC